MESHGMEAKLLAKSDLGAGLGRAAADRHPRPPPAAYAARVMQNLEEFPSIKKAFKPEWVWDEAVAAAPAEEEGRAPHHLIARLSDLTAETFRLHSGRLSGWRPDLDLGPLRGPVTLESIQSPTPLPPLPPPPPGCGPGALASLEHLEFLDAALELLEDAGQRTDGYAKKMRNSDQFWDTFSEIVAVAPFVGRRRVSFEPPAGSRRLDAAVQLGPQRVLVEVIAPRTWGRLCPGTAHKVTANRLAEKILGKAEGQIPSSDPRGDPIVVAVDTGHSEIGWWSAESLLLGPPIRKATIDRAAAAEIVVSATRDAENSLHGLDARTDSISAIVCFQRMPYADPAVAVSGTIAYNPHAAVPLAGEARDAIEAVLRGFPLGRDQHGGGGR